MKPTSESNPFVLPPALLAEVEAAADAEHRTVADVLRDVVERGLAERRLPLTDAYRQDLREKIAQGLQSLRDGKGTDGEAFMAGMNAELAELERQGR
jgi:antitoxin ParD1/3/4